MPDGTETLEELQAKLKALGLPTGEWGQTKGGTVESPILNKQAEALKKAKDLLEQQLTADRDLLSELHEQVNRLEHGGGA
jgi:hypothetical protein